jgi:opacity protein-like surface antigen
MRFKLTLATVACLVAVPAAAQDVMSPGRGTYASIFGGGGFGSDIGVTQRGTAYFLEIAGGPLAVNATGKAGSTGVGFIGGQIGHEWSSGSLVLPAVELEGFYLATGGRSATVNNPTSRLDEHTFNDTFSLNNSVFLANLVFSMPTSYYNLTPYIGGGFGAARVSATGADSLQIAPPEAGVNHFNSDPDSSAFTFAAQLKAGVRVTLGPNAFLFGEYRYLYVGATDQTFGSTVFPGHAETSPWTVSLDGTNYSLATAGIGINF